MKVTDDYHDEVITVDDETQEEFCICAEPLLERYNHYSECGRCSKPVR